MIANQIDEMRSVNKWKQLHGLAWRYIECQLLTTVSAVDLSASRACASGLVSEATILMSSSAWISKGGASASAFN